MSLFVRNIVGADDLRDVKNPAASALRKGTFVKIKASPAVPDEVDPCSAATDDIYGVVYGCDIPAYGYGTIQIRGKAIVFGGGDVPIGSKVTSDANGDGVATTTAEDVIAGIANSVGADGTYFEVELGVPNAHVPTA